MMWVLLGAAVILVGFVVVIALQPADYRVTRTATLPTAPAAVFDQVNDFHRWRAWSPWARLDPDAKYAYSGPSAGVGAAFEWNGNSKMGAGGMTIAESRRAELIRLRLVFIRPFASTADTEFTFKPEGGGTAVTWAMTGRKNFMSKAFGLFVDMDKLIGADFERGLGNLRTVIEAPSPPVK